MGLKSIDFKDRNLVKKRNSENSEKGNWQKHTAKMRVSSKNFSSIFFRFLLKKVQAIFAWFFNLFNFFQLSLARRIFSREVPKESFKSNSSFSSSSPISSLANQVSKAPSYSGQVGLLLYRINDRIYSQKADSPVASAGAAILCAVACVIYLNQDLAK